VPKLKCLTGVGFRGQATSLISIIWNKNYRNGMHGIKSAALQGNGLGN
jgi:hypothetical protein